MRRLSKISILMMCVALISITAGCGSSSGSAADTENFSFEYGSTSNDALMSGESIGVCVTNNSDRAAAALEIEAKACDADGNVLKYTAADPAYDEYDSRGDIVMIYDVGTLMPGESTAIDMSQDFAEISQKPDHLEFGIEKVIWKDPEELDGKLVEVLDYDIDTENDLVTVRIRNDSDVSYPSEDHSAEINYVILARDDDGKIAGATSLMSLNVPAGEDTTEELVFFAEYELTPLGASSYELFAQAVNYAD